MVAAGVVEVDGRPARVWRGGAGPGLLLLHGGIGDAALHWRPVWDALAGSFAVAAPDLPGFGGSAPLPRLSYAALVEWTAALVDALGLAPAAVAGNSIGAAIARLLAAGRPDLVTHLVLAGGGEILSVPAFARPLMQSRLAGPFLEVMRRQSFSPGSLRRMIAAPALLTPAFVAETRRASRAFVAMVRDVGMTDPPAARTPRAPTLVLWGAADRLAPPDRGRRIAAEIPGSSLRVLDGAGHVPQLDRPAAFVEAVRAFCLPAGAPPSE